MSSSIVFIGNQPTTSPIVDWGTSLPTPSPTSPDKYFLIGGTSQGVYVKLTDGTNFWYTQISN